MQLIRPVSATDYNRLDITSFLPSLFHIVFCHLW